MTGLQFLNYQKHQVRLHLKDNEVWFIAKDVAEILDYSETAQMTRHLDNDEVMSVKLTGMNMNSTLISEAGLYSAIFRSRKPEAKTFKRWITHQVLPSIRRHGAYMTEDVLEKVSYNPAFMQGLLDSLKQEQEAKLKAEQQLDLLLVENKELKPKAEKWEEFISSKGLYTLTTIGKQFLGGLSAIEVREKLQAEEVLFQNKVNGVYHPRKGYEKLFQVIPFMQTDSEGNSSVVNNTLKVTPEGVDFIINLLT